MNEWYNTFMATKQSTIDFLLDQIAALGNVRARKMFGEYAVYYTEKVVGFVCDDTLFLKPTTIGRKIIKDLEEAPPYPGAKNYFKISEDLWDDREGLMHLISQTAQELPMPKPKKKK
jgi:DNA transformation protein